MRLFGLGFATPYLGAFRADAWPLGALMPAELGAVSWPREGHCSSVLVDETELPLHDECADRLLLVHMLEWSERSRALLARALAGAGAERAAAHHRAQPPRACGRGSIPRRSAMAARSAARRSRSCSRTPCSPRRSGNTRSTCRPSLGVSCSNGRCSGSGSGLVLWPAFSGVIMVEATKQIYAAVPVKEVRKAAAARCRCPPV